MLEDTAGVWGSPLLMPGSCVARPFCVKLVYAWELCCSAVLVLRVWTPVGRKLRTYVLWECMLIGLRTILWECMLTWGWRSVLLSNFGAGGAQFLWFCEDWEGLVDSRPFLSCLAFWAVIGRERVTWPRCLGFSRLFQAVSGSEGLHWSLNLGGVCYANAFIMLGECICSTESDWLLGN